MKTALPESVPSDKIETATVWSFPERGKWSTHSAKYRGNWAPQIARNLILLYSQEGDTVLDPMVGSGTTMIETKLLGRKGIAFDIHPEVVVLAQEAYAAEEKGKFDPKIERGDARHLSTIKNDSVDFIATHPPYLNIIRYGEKDVEGDLSAISNLNKFCDQIESVAQECFRVLKLGKSGMLKLVETL